MELKQVGRWKFQAENQLIVEMVRAKEGPKCAFLVYCQEVAQFHFTKTEAFSAVQKQSKGVLLNKWQRGLPMGDALWDWMEGFDELFEAAAAESHPKTNNESNLLPLQTAIEGLEPASMEAGG